MDITTKILLKVHESFRCKELFFKSLFYDIYCDYIQTVIKKFFKNVKINEYFQISKLYFHYY